MPLVADDPSRFRAPIGTADVLPPESSQWTALVSAFADRASRYGFDLVITPIFEHLEVFQRVGESTDVVRKEMYDFEDKGGRRIALRPEGTAGVARALAHGFYRALGLRDITLSINSMGDEADRAAYVAVLREYLLAHAGALGDTFRERVEVNPLRLLDSKDPDWQDVI